MPYDPVAEHLEYEKRKPYHSLYYQGRQESLKDYQKQWRHNNRELRMLQKARERAKREGLPCTITVDQTNAASPSLQPWGQGVVAAQQPQH